MAKKDLEKTGTVHDAKNELIRFYKNEQENRLNKSKAKEWEIVKKALQKYNKVVKDERERLEDEVKSGKNVNKNMKILSGKEGVITEQLDLPKVKMPDGSLKKISTVLSSKFYSFKLKERSLKELNYEQINNKINYFSGKDFYFIVDTGFGKVKVDSSEMKKLSKMSEENVSEFLVNKYKEVFESRIENDKKKISKEEQKRREFVYDKIRSSINHNLSVATNKQYKTPLAQRNKKGGYKRGSKKESLVPMLFKMLNEEIKIMIP